jgi:hypothetical protein
MLRRLQGGEITEIEVVIDIDIETNTEYESKSEEDSDETDEAYVIFESYPKVDVMVLE